MHDIRHDWPENSGVWLGRPSPVEVPRLPNGELTLLLAVLVLLCGNGPAVIMHRVLGLTMLPVWPLYLTLYGAVGLLLWTRVGVARSAVFAGAPALLVSALPLLSTLWSATPADTAVQAATLAGTALCGFYLAAGVPVSQAIRLLAIVAVMAPALDLLAITAMPSVGIEQDGPWVGTWRGLHDQKNGLGAYATLQSLLLLMYARAQRRLNAVIVTGLLLNLFLLFSARSTTSWLTAGLCVPVMLAPRLVLWIGGRIFVVGIVSFAIALLIEPDFGTMLLQSLPGMVGKDSTLSNRLPVWAVLAPFIETAPWLGYGYGAFWSQAMMPGDLFLSTIKFLPGSAHSSIVELRLGLGWLGLATMAVLLLSWIAALWSCDHPSETDPDRTDLAPIGHALFVFVIFQGLTESLLLTRNDLVWVLVVWVSTRLAMAARTGASTT